MTSVDAGCGRDNDEANRPAGLLKVTSGHQLSSNPNLILGCALATFVARVEHPTRLDQQELDLMFSVRPVFDALWDDEHLAR